MPPPICKPVSPADLASPPATPGKAAGQPHARHQLSRWHRLLLALLCVALLLTALAHPIERGVGNLLAAQVPGSWVYSGSIRALERLDTVELSPSQLPDAVQMQIRSQFAALRMPSNEAPLYELVFRRSSKLGPVSFALAGGQIVVTDGFVAANPSEQALMSGLALQLGHLQHRHALRAITDRAPLAMLRSLLSDDAQRGIQLISTEQPVLEHDDHCVEEAQRFADTVMQLNPSPRLVLAGTPR